MAERYTSQLVAFGRIADQALSRSESVLKAFLPDGRREGAEWVATNPTRTDKRRGSFKANINTGKWADFSTGDKGGDLISLVAYVTGKTQRDAAIALAEALGLNPFE